MNKVFNTDWLDNDLRNKCAQLIIADPPYFETKGEFDFVWNNFAEYLDDVEKWVKECKRVLADNGTLLWFGSSKNIAYTQVIIDKYLKLINNLVWEKAEADGLFGSSGNNQLRSFPNSTERILMYSNEWDISSNSIIIDKAVLKTRDYLRSEIIKSKGEINLNVINLIFGSATNGGGIASGVLSNNKLTNTMITNENYKKLKKWLNTKADYEYLKADYEYLKADYEDLKADYEDLRRPFQNIFKSTDVIKVRFKPSEYDHETVKPENLARVLILTCSKPNGLVVIPFSGSGTECAMAVKEGRKCIGFDINPKHVKTANARLEAIDVGLLQTNLFEPKQIAIQEAMNFE